MPIGWGDRERAPVPFTPSDGAAAEKDYADRAADYQRRYHVREVKAPISRQMEEAGRQAQERQSQPVPKKDAPDRGER